jgi:WhiB family redox-sensing transcriptional regulator
VKTSITLRSVGPPPLDEWPPQACRGADWRLFFSEVPGGFHRRREEQAKAICQRCQALRSCLAYALPIVDLSGVWAGMNAAERRSARKKQQKEA